MQNAPAAAGLVRNTEGTQTIEYDLLIAQISIVLVLVLAAGNSDFSDAFDGLASRITDCFHVGASTC